MSKRGENIYKRKDGRWEGRYKKEYEKNKYGYVYGKTYKAVKEKLLVYRTNETIKYDGCLQSVLLDIACDEWLLSCRPAIKESSYVKYYNIIANHIKPVLGTYQLYQIDNSTIENFAAEKLTNGRLDGKGGLSVKTIKEILKVVESVLKYACRKGFIMREIHQKVLFPQTPKKDMRIFSKSEQELLETYLLTEADRNKIGVLLCMYTGLRIGEVCALRWSDFNFHDKTLFVKHTVQRVQNINNTEQQKTKITETSPKSQSSIRMIPLPEFLIEILLKYEPKCKEAYFLTGELLKVIEPRTYQNYFKKYIKEAGVADANFHALRHSFATNCVEVGFEIKSLSEILGHSTTQITLDRYVHPTMDLKRRNINKLQCSINMDCRAG